jgi:ribonuclease HI
LVIRDHRTSVTTEHSAFLDSGTNNTAEVAAIIFALELYVDYPHLPITIHTDSSYAIGAAGSNSVNANQRLIYYLRHELIAKRNPRPVFRKVAAHLAGGDPNNDRADRLAAAAREARSPVLPTTSALNRLLSNAAAASDSPGPIVPPPVASHDQTQSASGSSSSPSFTSDLSNVVIIPSRCLPNAVQLLPQQRSEQIAPTYLRETISTPSLGPGPTDYNTQLQLRLRSRVLRAKAMVRRGLIREAVQLIERAPLPELTKERIDHLLSLHPRCRHAASPPPARSTAIAAVITGEELKKMIKACDRGKSPGPSNLTAGHLAGLATDPQCLEGLVAIVQDIVNGNLSTSAIDIIASAVSVATDKGGDQVRPLAVPEVLYKVAAMFVIASIEQHMPSLFSTIQLGCGTRSGVEIAIHKTQTALEAQPGGIGSDTVVLSLDFRNAFNERQRHTIARALYSLRRYCL